MITEIEVKARGDLKCPDYVTKLDKLDKDLFTWKKAGHSTDDKEGEIGTKLYHLFLILLFIYFLKFLSKIFHIIPLFYF